MQVGGGNWTDDNFLGYYATPPDAWGHPGDTVFVSDPYANAQVPGFSFSLAPQDRITSATLTLTLPVAQISSNHATVGIAYVDGFPRPSDFANPYMVDPTFGPTTASTAGLDIYFNGEPWLGSDLTPWLVINGNHLSSDPSQGVSVVGRMDFTAPIAGPAYNWEGYIGGQGYVDVPYTLEIDGTYTVTPEPSTLVLFGTTLLGLAAKLSFRSHRRHA